jgi:hypothetical protein
MTNHIDKRRKKRKKKLFVILVLSNPTRNTVTYFNANNFCLRKSTNVRVCFAILKRIIGLLMNTRLRS